MLFFVVGVVRPQVRTFIQWCRIGHGIELMVAHYRQGMPLFYHGPDDFECLALMGTSVYKVPQKHYLSFCMLVYAGALGVSQLFEQRCKRSCMPVYVADEVVVHKALHGPPQPIP